ncbi:MAG: hypothetical protein ACE5GT_02960 [Rhodospirillales bacterium]
MKTTLLIAFLGGMLAFAVTASAYMWWQLSDVALGVHGTVALIGGVVFTAAVGIVLMRLVYYSQRHGHDDRQR